MIWTRHLIKSRIDGENVLAFNALTGALDVFPIYFFDNPPAEFIPKLKERGYVFDTASQEEKLFNQVALSYELSNSQKVAQFILCPTFSCNLKCTYCFEGALTRKNDTMAAEMVAKVISAINELKSGYKKSAISFFGGEPLLSRNKTLVTNLIKFAKRSALPIGIVSNGVELGDFKELLQDNLDVVRLIQITLDGEKKYHDSRRLFKDGRGTFEIIINNVSKIVDLGIIIAFRINVDSNNFDGLQNLADLFIKKGWHEKSNISFNLAMLQKKNNKMDCCQLDEGELLAKFKKKVEENPKFSIFSINKNKRFLGHLVSVFGNEEDDFGPRLNYCESNYGGFYVFGPDGYIYPCPEALGNKNHRIGRYYPSFKFYENKNDWFNRSILTIPKCKQCAYAFLCGGGCAYQSAKKTGTPLNPVCGDAKKVVDDFLVAKAKEVATCSSFNKV